MIRRGFPRPDYEGRLTASNILLPKFIHSGCCAADDEFPFYLTIAISQCQVFRNELRLQHLVDFISSVSGVIGKELHDHTPIPAVLLTAPERMLTGHPNRDGTVAHAGDSTREVSLTRDL